MAGELNLIEERLFIKGLLREEDTTEGAMWNLCELSSFMLWSTGLQCRDLTGVNFHSGHGAKSMRKNAQKHCSHDGESDGGHALLMHRMLEIHEPKHDGRQPARAEPSHK